MAASCAAAPVEGADRAEALVLHGERQQEHQPGGEPAPERPILLGRCQFDSDGDDIAEKAAPQGHRGSSLGADQQFRGDGEGTSSNATDSGVAHSQTLLSLTGAVLQRVGTGFKLQRASTLPTDTRDLRYAATMPSMYDIEAPRPFCGGLWKTTQFIGFGAGIVIFLFFVFVRPIDRYSSANDMLGITAVCACFWVFEVIPVYMTAFFPLVLMPLLKITSSEIAAHAYWEWISLLIVAVFLVGIALVEAQLPRRLALTLLLRVGSMNPAALLACLMGMCWASSMFCNSTAVTLLLTPFAIGLVNAAEEHVRNSVVVDSAEEGGPPVNGVLTMMAGEEEVAEVQRFGRGLLLGIAFSSTSGGLATLTGAISNDILPGESLVAEYVTSSKWFLFALPISVTTVVLAFCFLYAHYVRNSKISVIQREVLQEEYEQLLSEVGPLSRDELLVGLLQVLQIVILIIRPFAISPFVQTAYGADLINDATLAFIPALLLFFLPSAVRPGQALLTWPAVQEKLDFGLLLLIGGSLAINTGFTESGLDIALGELIAKSIPHVHPLVLDALIIASVTLSTQLFSGIGTAAAMLPVLASAAMEAIVNPLALMLPATVAASFAFLLPTAAPANVIVFAKSQELQSQLRMKDFLRPGALLTVAAVLAGAVLSHAMGRLVFDAQSPFPDWACSAPGVLCVFAPVPGIVQGRHVDAQACMMLVGPEDGEVCRLWNGTLLDTAPLLPPA
mmetsp:Transcript_100891/g.261107  ORF Transcript_100891/g.261107 Transcript_100891/m.261107 type:complete len:732 (+) Transcript_100891:85-2280(+)